MASTNDQQNTSSQPDQVALQSSPAQMLMLVTADGKIITDSIENVSYLISDSWIVDKANEFITKWEDLPDVDDLVGWKELDTISTQDKRLFKRAWVSRRINQGRNKKTPFGSILIGPRSAGKTTVAISWCHHIEGTLIELDSRAQGPLRGQTEK